MPLPETLPQNTEEEEEDKQPAMLLTLTVCHDANITHLDASETTQDSVL